MPLFPSNPLGEISTLPHSMIFRPGDPGDGGEPVLNSIIVGPYPPANAGTREGTVSASRILSFHR